MTARAVRSDDRDLLLGEWACLGLIYPAPTHGFAIAARLKPDGDVGRVWSLSRARTYRAIEQLADRGLVRAVGEEPGLAGGNRTILAATRTGRAALRAWVRTPVTHLRDLRSELLLKMVVARICSIDVAAMLDEQRSDVVELSDAIAAQLERDPTDVVTRWRSEVAHAALRFLDGVRVG